MLEEFRAQSFTVPQKAASQVKLKSPRRVWEMIGFIPGAPALLRLLPSPPPFTLSKGWDW